MDKKSDCLVDIVRLSLTYLCSDFSKVRPWRYCFGVFGCCKESKIFCSDFFVFEKLLRFGKVMVVSRVATRELSFREFSSREFSKYLTSRGRGNEFENYCDLSFSKHSKNKSRESLRTPALLVRDFFENSCSREKI